MMKSCDTRGGVQHCDSVQCSSRYIIWFLKQPKAHEANTFTKHLPCARHSGKYFAFILLLNLRIRALQEIRFLSPVCRQGVQVSRPLITCLGHKAGEGHRWHLHMGTWLQRPHPSSCWCHPERQCPAEHISEFLVQSGPDLWEIDGDLRPKVWGQLSR